MYKIISEFVLNLNKIFYPGGKSSRVSNEKQGLETHIFSSDPRFQPPGPLLGHLLNIS
jgi:hypothetical protein